LNGQTELPNLALACPHCNAHKWTHISGFDEQTNRETPLFDPRLDAWLEHFAFADDGSWRLVGKTPRGRATIARLQINHPDMVNTRQLLAELGVLAPTGVRHEP
jgi:hypothetical protein